ncbi:unnamed protein product [Closterium sp. Naga37s-1]|nr:unnamed protein product [Closterium sp. Naga37s-1]
MDRRGSACPSHALRLVAVLLIITVAPAAAGRRIDTLGTAINADSGTATAGTATSVDATAGASASDLSALAVDTKTKQEIKALAPLIGAADLAGVDKPPRRASYLTKDAFATATTVWAIHPPPPSTDSAGTTPTPVWATLPPPSWIPRSCPISTLSRATSPWVSRSTKAPRSSRGISNAAWTTARCIYLTKISTRPKFNISMYEQVPLPGPLGLILALQQQPVIVTIRASSEDFINYAGGVYQGWGCYNPLGTIFERGRPAATATATNNTALLDHVMLAVGYNYEAPGSWANYFILKNSWGPDWGEGGYMKIRMENGPFGTCGMLVNRGLYPVVKVPQTTDPCNTCPCGGGTCVADASGNGKYTCQCTDQLAPAVNRDGTPTCTIINVCSILPNNPCAVGQCINIGDGGYSCLCPPNYKPSVLASGQTTCVPDMSTSTAAAVQGTYTVQGGETCGAIYGFIGLTQEQFLLQNKGVDCENLKAGQLLNISIPSSAQVCRVRYSVTQADAAAKSCDPINNRFGIDVTTINPNLDCSSLVPNQQICIQVGDAVSGAADYNLCTSYLPVNEWITCANAVDWYQISWFDLYRLNPGINCDTLTALTASEICIAGTPLGAVACGKARSKTVANRRYTVGAGDSCASLVVVQFQRQPPLVGELNRGWMCRSQSLFAGMPLCIPS